ncbi:MCP methyltransferase, CheR-type [Thermodesulfatator indicus DSM 15286]|uniref:protein-glutamate O-methyltransferase n=1 Tax=Thermodesulfatator indicus (strain DSM 15286 / JCM 11887 / CIR29812) TaxID=667014 RepID=F8AA95_THEID|nr:protein-glutamate O-methyltransferase CheR [Thermodesulfatator indicus]AEH44231.1 MCP methyltransferase, CheR-type [Thermodesulfatator indicus DSM 15286]
MRPEVYRFFADLVFKHSGIVLKEEKTYLIESRLRELARALNYRDVDQLYQVASKRLTPQLRDEIIEAMTTNETYFFRDQHPFEALRKVVIPELKKLREKEKELRFWSAAASTGQEPYSLAMLIHEYFPDLLSWRIQILATDISQEALKKGQKGEYSQIEVNRGLPVTFLVKYFKQNGAKWKVQDKIRRMIQFRKLNLVEPFPPTLGKFDVVFCRYVLIYFSPEIKAKVLKNISRVMKPKGYLFLGATESPQGLPQGFKRKIIGRTICYQWEG